MSLHNIFFNNALTRRFIVLAGVILLLTVVIAIISFFPSKQAARDISIIAAAIAGIGICLIKIHKLLITNITVFSSYIHGNSDEKELQKNIDRSIPEYSTIMEHLIKLAPKKHIHDESDKKLHKEITNLQEQLHAKTALLTNASHEIRTPLQGVCNISTALDEEWDKYNTPKKREMVHVLAESADRLNHLVDSLLDLSKINAGKMLFDHKKVDVSHIIKDVANEFINTQLPEHNLVLSYHIEPSYDFSTLGDDNKLQQLVRNLISNAIKFTKKGKVTISLRHHTSNQMLIKVQDEGMGIPKEEIGSIFEPFVQSTLTRHMSGSTGVGLALCKEIVEGHHGTIWAENNPQTGASFAFTLPYALNEEKLDSNLVKKGNNTKSIIKLLMVDDEEICHYSTKIILSSEPNIIMLSAYNADEALHILEEHSDIEIILLDMMMPGTDGIELLQEIKKNPLTQHIKIIMQSGVANPQQIQHAISLGANSFATKPTSKKILQQIFDALFSETT